MKDETKTSELPPQAKPTDIPEAEVKERKEPADALRHPAVGAESSSATHMTLLGSARAALPANAEPLAGMVEQLQHQYGNTYVQRLLAEVRASTSDEVAHEKQSTSTIRHHAQEIARLPWQGMIDAAGRFSVMYAYDLTSGGDFLTLILAVPAGVTVAALPLTHMHRDDYCLTDPGSTHTRAVTIAVSIHVPTPPKMQVTLTQGNSAYVVVFHFRRSSIPPPAPESEGHEEGDTES
jgi:hypothetical protein